MHESHVHLYFITLRRGLDISVLLFVHVLLLLLIILCSWSIVRPQKLCFIDECFSLHDCHVTLSRLFWCHNRSLQSLNTLPCFYSHFCTCVLYSKLYSSLLFTKEDKDSKRLCFLQNIWRLMFFPSNNSGGTCHVIMWTRSFLCLQFFKSLTMTYFLKYSCSLPVSSS